MKLWIPAGKTEKTLQWWTVYISKFILWPPFEEQRVKPGETMNRYHLPGPQKVAPWMGFASCSNPKCTKWVKNLRLLYGTEGFHGGRNPVTTAMVLPSCLGCSHRRQILHECPVQRETESHSSSSRQRDLTDNLFLTPLHQSHRCPSVSTVST